MCCPLLFFYYGSHAASVACMRPVLSPAESCTQRYNGFLWGFTDLLVNVRVIAMSVAVMRVETVSIIGFICSKDITVSSMPPYTELELLLFSSELKIERYAFL